MSLFESTNYKDILLGLIRNKGKLGRGYYRKISEHLNVHPTLVSQVLSGSKDFTAEQMLSVCQFFGLPTLDTKYLVLLVQVERAGSKSLKDHLEIACAELRAQARQLSNRVERGRELTDYEQSIFYSSWIYSAVHLLTTLEKKLTFEQICRYLNISPIKIRKIVDFLLSIQMITEDKGKFYAGTTVTHLAQNSDLISRHHTNWRLKAIEKSEELTAEELMYSVNVSMSKKDFSIFREELIQLIQQFLKRVHKSPAEDLAQFNMDFFWLKK